MALSMYAASFTVLVIGPTVSCTTVIGTTTLLDVSPVLGLIPTTPFILDGPMIEPPVSVPTVKAAKPRLAATADPLELPEGSWSS